MNAVSIILYIAAGFAGLFILTRLLVRALKILLLVALAVFLVSWIRFSHTPLCSHEMRGKLPTWAAPLCKDTGVFSRR